MFVPSLELTAREFSLLELLMPEIPKRCLPPGDFGFHSVIDESFVVRIVPLMCNVKNIRFETG